MGISEASQPAVRVLFREGPRRKLEPAIVSKTSELCSVSLSLLLPNAAGPAKAGHYRRSLSWTLPKMAEQDSTKMAEAGTTGEVWLVIDCGRVRDELQVQAPQQRRSLSQNIFSRDSKS